MKNSSIYISIRHLKTFIILYIHTKLTDGVCHCRDRDFRRGGTRTSGSLGHRIYYLSTINVAPTMSDDNHRADDNNNNNNAQKIYNLKK